MEYGKQISKAEFLAQSRRNGIHYEAIFGDRKALMETIFAMGDPIYCDQSYYVQEDKLDRVEKVGDHFECAGYKKFEEWRDCHYYNGYFDADGKFIWIMTGGRYD